MSNDITVEDCRKLLTQKREDFYSYQEEKVFYGRVYRVIVDSLSLEERFNLAKMFHKELEFYEEFRLMDEKKAQSVSALLDSIRDYQGIIYDDFVFLLDKVGIGFITMLVMNSAFPIEFLLDGSYLKRHVNHPSYFVLEYAVDLAMDNRKTDILSHYRNLVPNSESMSDEMVLSVAGVKL